MPLTPAQRLLAVHAVAAEHFTSGDWLSVGLLAERPNIVSDHRRLLRSLSFGDEDYSGAALEVLTQMLRENPASLTTIEEYVATHYPPAGEFISAVGSERVITFAPSVFQIPNAPVDPKLVAVMMPFEQSFARVYEAIKAGISDSGNQFGRADDMWEHATVIQDIFSLIFRSRIVVVDFTGKNANVMYETGIAHALGKHVVPISQSLDDVPFDIRHHRVLKYLPNGEGLAELRSALGRRIAGL